MAEKDELYRELTAQGYTFDKPYKNLTLEDVRAAAVALKPAATESIDVDDSELSDFAPAPEKAPLPETQLPPRPHIPVPSEPVVLPGLPAPLAPLMQDQPAIAGVPEEYVLIDEQGRHWIQREVRKPQTAEPRGRRKVTYTDPGIGSEVTVKDPDGRYTETFEMPGTEQRVAEARVTLPSYQVGIYRHRSLPFKIHVYNDQEGYDLLEVWEYYGGETRVPKECLKKYVSNSLVYDIASVNQAITDEDNRNKLYGNRAVAAR